MFNVGRNGIITLTRGDSFTTPLYINIGTTLEPIMYRLAPGDKLYFGVMEPHAAFEDSIIRKTFSSSDYDTVSKCVKLHFRASDTENVVPGTYYYEVKLLRTSSQRVNGVIQSEDIVDTVIPRTKFFIVE